MLHKAYADLDPKTSCIQIAQRTTTKWCTRGCNRAHHVGQIAQRTTRKWCTRGCNRAHHVGRGGVGKGRGWGGEGLRYAGEGCTDSAVVTAAVPPRSSLNFSHYETRTSCRACLIGLGNCMIAERLLQRVIAVPDITNLQRL